MAIKYALYPNHLTADPDDYMAIVQDQESHDMEDIIDRMISRGSTVTKAEALSNLEEYELAIFDILAEGGSINTRVMNVEASVSGVFKKVSNFDASKHYVRFNMNPGERVREALRKVEVEKVDADKPEPVPELFKDLASGTNNDTLTPGGIGELIGNLLKVDPSDANQGIFFIAADGTETKVESIARNKPSNLIFLIPAGLVSGEYTVEVRTKLQDVTEIRAGSLDTMLIIP